MATGENAGKALELLMTLYKMFKILKAALEASSGANILLKSSRNSSRIVLLAPPNFFLQPNQRSCMLNHCFAVKLGFWAEWPLPRAKTGELYAF